MKIVTVVVTYNRIELLKKCIDCLNNQTLKATTILIINNASTDGTKEYLDSMESDIIQVKHLNENLGGAGGFQLGIKLAYEKGADFIWLMDDDTLVEPDALEQLMVANEKMTERNIGLLASNVLYKDNTPCIMNVPLVNKGWNEFASEGIVKITTTSFVGMLITRKVVEEIGLPIKEFFIWGDDVEYSQRITQSFEGYLVGKSIVKHYMAENKGTNIIEDSVERVNRYYYAYRNFTYMAKRRGILSLLSYIKSTLITFGVIILRSNYKWKKSTVIIKGVFGGLFFNPQIKKIEH